MVHPTVFFNPVFNLLNEVYEEGYHSTFPDWADSTADMAAEIQKTAQNLSKAIERASPAKPFILKYMKGWIQALCALVWMQGIYDGKGEGDITPEPPSSTSSTRINTILAQVFEAGGESPPNPDMLKKGVEAFTRVLSDMGLMGRPSSVVQRMAHPLVDIVFASGSLKGTKSSPKLAFRARLRQLG